MINASKHELVKLSVKFLGHLVSSSGVAPLSVKVAATQDYPDPQSHRQIRQFVSLVNFNRCFIPNCAEAITPPLTDLLPGVKRKFAFPKAAKQALIFMKEVAAKIVPLAQPDPAVAISLITNASNTAFGAVPQQYTDGSWKPIAFFSEQLQPAGSRYSTLCRNFLAV